jgi:hypothetical protein
MTHARRRLGYEIGAVIAAKLVLLSVLYFAFFAERAPNDAPAMAAHVMGDR